MHYDTHKVITIGFQDGREAFMGITFMEKHR